MTRLPDLFPGFAERRVEVGGGIEIFARVGGVGPPLLLLHGYPQTHVCWHKVAPELARHCTLVIADLRGYGDSSAPPGDDAHLIYSKRAMGEDCLALMRALGHQRFMVAGHDRGGRVAYRLALDHPEPVSALVPVDIIPTGEAWSRANAAWALKTYHWAFLAQPRPMPERMISNDPIAYLEHTLKGWTKGRDLSPFSEEAMVHYRRQFEAPERVHALCEDYRAGAGIDRELDDADRAAGRKITCPTLVLYAGSYLASSPIPVWQAWCSDVTGASVDSGHFLAEENPEDTLAALVPFLLTQRG